MAISENLFKVFRIYCCIFFLQKMYIPHLAMSPCGAALFLISEQIKGRCTGHGPVFLHTLHYILNDFPLGIFIYVRAKDKKKKLLRTKMVDFATICVKSKH